MFKRIWIVGISLLALLVLAACGSGELAEDLTPIPSLAPGQTPTLVAVLQGGAQATEEAGQAGTEEAEEANATEESSAEGDATEEADATEEGGVGEDVTAGQQIFNQSCTGCHAAEDGVGPTLVGLSERADERVEGMSAEEYIHQSILDPHAYVVEEFQDIMPSFEGQLSEAELTNLIAFLLTQ